MQSWIRKTFFRLLLCRPLIRLYDRFRLRTSLGAQGELAAQRYLLKQGLVIIERGYRDKLGEIDIIAVDHRTIVFVEVKTRGSDSVLDAVEAVDEAKQTQIARAAKSYLKWHHLERYKVRFDVVAVLWPDGVREPKLVHYRDAFEAPDQFQMF
jgi:putative endonuclease